MNKKFIFKILKILIALGLLLFILTKINFEQLFQIFTTGNPYTTAAACIVFPAQYILFTLRWKLILQKFAGVRIPFFELLGIMYRGIFVGYFLPGSVGIDVYRWHALKKYNVTELQISLLFLEKVVAIFVCLFLIGISMLFITVTDTSILLYFKHIIVYSSIALGVGILILFIFQHNFILQKILQSINDLLYKIINFFCLKFNITNIINPNFLKQIFKFLINPKFILLIVLFSLINQLTNVVVSNIVFNGFSANLKLVENLFANPLLNIIFLLPISFGSIGVREGAYILVFGLFGIVSEMSLLVSFIYLTATFLNIILGGILYIIHKSKHTNG